MAIDAANWPAMSLAASAAIFDTKTLTSSAGTLSVGGTALTWDGTSVLGITRSGSVQFSGTDTALGSGGFLGVDSVGAYVGSALNSTPTVTRQDFRIQVADTRAAKWWGDDTLGFGGQAVFTNATDTAAPPATLGAGAGILTLFRSAATTLGTKPTLLLANAGAANSYAQIGFGGGGSGAALSDTNCAAAIGYLATSATGSTKGDILFGTRSVTTDTAPTERMRIAADGTLTITGATAAPHKVLGGVANNDGTNSPLMVGNSNSLAAGNANIAQFFSDSFSTAKFTFRGDGVLLCADVRAPAVRTTTATGAFDGTATTGGNAVLWVTATTDTPSVTWTAHVPSADPAGYIKIQAGGVNKYVPYWT